MRTLGLSSAPAQCRNRRISLGRPRRSFAVVVTSLTLLGGSFGIHLQEGRRHEPSWATQMRAHLRAAKGRTRRTAQVADALAAFVLPPSPTTTATPESIVPVNVPTVPATSATVPTTSTTAPPATVPPSTTAPVTVPPAPTTTAVPTMNGAAVEANTGVRSGVVLRPWTGPYQSSSVTG